MNKRKFAWIAVAIALVFGIAGVCWNLFGIHQITMTQAELQQRIDAKMPHTSKNGVTVSAVRLNLDGDKIGLSFEASATKLKTELFIKAETRGDLSYNSLNGTFHFRPALLQLKDVKANGESVAARLDRFVDKWVDSPKIIQNKDALVKTGSNLVDKLVQAAAEKTLEHTPVYKLPDNFKGNVTKMFLQSVEVTEGKVIAHLSFWQFTKIVIFYAFVGLLSLALAAALLMNPEWGIPIIVLGGIDFQ